MADIDVQKKKPSIWPWIIGILAIIVIIWIVYEVMEDDDEMYEDTDTENVLDDDATGWEGAKRSSNAELLIIS